MNNKTFETIQQTITRFETIVEVDTALKDADRKKLKSIVHTLKQILHDTEPHEIPML